MSELLPREIRAAICPADKRAAGLYGKFRVTRTDGRDAPGQKHDGCEYFVLDLTHDEFATPAIEAYAKACAGEFPALAKDLRRIVTIERAGAALTRANDDPRSLPRRSSPPAASEGGMETPVDPRRSSATCYYCKLHDARVEAGGVYYCPNPLCTGCGAGPHRRKLKSYVDGNDGYEIDVQELYDTYWPEIAALAPDDPMRLAAERAVNLMRERGWLPAPSTPAPETEETP